MSDAISDWILESERFGGYPHFAEIENKHSHGKAAEFSHSDGLGWLVGASQFNGYAHPQVPNRDSGGVPFRFTLSDTDYFGWQLDAEAFNYPHVYFRKLTPPPQPPPPLAVITSLDLNIPGQYFGNETSVTVSLGLQHVVNGDEIIGHASKP